MKYFRKGMQCAFCEPGLRSVFSIYLLLLTAPRSPIRRNPQELPRGRKSSSIRHQGDAPLHGLVYSPAQG